jgi:hypothetical protein
MATNLPDMGQIGTQIQQRLTNLENQTETNANNLNSFEQQLVDVCNSVASGGTATQQLSSEEN